MPLRSLFFVASLLAVSSGCSKFTGREADASVPLDMQVVTVDAGVDAGDGAVEPDAAALPTVVVPAVRITQLNGQIRVATYTNPVPRDVAENTPPAEPYCLAVPSVRHNTMGVRWATCAPGEGIQDCRRDGEHECDEYEDPTRALACALDGVSTRPTCVPLQYNFEERCAECPSTNVCVIRRTAAVECVPMLPDTGLSDGPACVRDRGPDPNRFAARTLGGALTFDGVPSSCEPNADCYFDINGTARCAEPAEPRDLYPIRGCDLVSGTETACYVSPIVGDPETPLYSATNLSAQSCKARRENTTPETLWATVKWTTHPSDSPCGNNELCDFSGANVTCTLPEWAFGTGPNEVCGDCLGVPCYVYEDGSHECMHEPTRTQDATRDPGVTIGCCQRLPGGGFQPGTCSTGGGFVATVGAPECGVSEPCAFDALGASGCDE